MRVELTHDSTYIEYLKDKRINILLMNPLMNRAKSSFLYRSGQMTLSTVHACTENLSKEISVNSRYRKEARGKVIDDGF